MAFGGALFLANGEWECTVYVHAPTYVQKYTTFQFIQRIFSVGNRNFHYCNVFLITRRGWEAPVCSECFQRHSFLLDCHTLCWATPSDETDAWASEVNTVTDGCIVLSSRTLTLLKVSFSVNFSCLPGTPTANNWLTFSGWQVLMSDPGYEHTFQVPIVHCILPHVLGWMHSK